MIISSSTVSSSSSSSCRSPDTTGVKTVLFNTDLVSSDCVIWIQNYSVSGNMWCWGKYLTLTGHLQTWIIPVRRLELPRGEEAQQLTDSTSQEISCLRWRSFWTRPVSGCVENCLALFLTSLRVLLWKGEEQVSWSWAGETWRRLYHEIFELSLWKTFLDVFLMGTGTFLGGCFYSEGDRSFCFLCQPFEFFVVLLFIMKNLKFQDLFWRGLKLWQQLFNIRLFKIIVWKTFIFKIKSPVFYCEGLPCIMWKI